MLERLKTARLKHLLFMFVLFGILAFYLPTSVEAAEVNYGDCVYPKGDKLTWTPNISPTSKAVCSAYGQTWAHGETDWIDFSKINMVSSKYELGNGSKAYIYLMGPDENKYTIVAPGYTFQSGTSDKNYGGIIYKWIGTTGNKSGTLDTTSFKGLYKVCYDCASYNASGQAVLYPVEVVRNREPEIAGSLPLIKCQTQSEHSVHVLAKLSQMRIMCL